MPEPVLLEVGRARSLATVAVTGGQRDGTMIRGCGERSGTLLTQTHASRSFQLIDFIEFQWDVPDRGVKSHKWKPSAEFGHFGYGGSLGLADPDAGVAFGYVRCRPGQRWQSPRTQALIDAVYLALAE